MCSPRCTESSSICHSYTLYITLINDIPLVLSTSCRGRGKEREREVRRNIGRIIQKDRMESEMKEKEQLEGERVIKRREGRGQKGTIRDLEPQGSTMYKLTCCMTCCLIYTFFYPVCNQIPQK